MVPNRAITANETCFLIIIIINNLTYSLVLILDFHKIINHLFITAMFYIRHIGWLRYLLPYSMGWSCGKHTLTPLTTTEICRAPLPINVCTIVQINRLSYLKLAIFHLVYGWNSVHELGSLHLFMILFAGVASETAPWVLVLASLLEFVDLFFEGLFT